MGNPNTMAMQETERKGDAELLTVEEAAEVIGITTQAIYQAIRRGSLPTTVKLVEKRVIRREDAEAYKQKSYRPATEAA